MYILSLPQKIILLGITSILISNMPHAFAQDTFETCHGKFFSYGKLECFTELANTGNADAEFSLGNFYYLGMGVKQDYTKARDYYQKAAEQGYPKAQYVLGFLYYWGDGVKKDYAKSYKYYQKAADQGYSLAQFQLGVLYILGQGVKQDAQQATSWLEKAAGKKIIDVPKASPSSKEVEDYLRMAYNLAHGVNGFSQDYKQAAHSYQDAANWYRNAAEQANINANTDAKKIPDRVSLQQIKDLKNLIRKADRGNVTAETDLALLYEKADWYKRFAGPDDQSQKYRLNEVYHQDWRQALKWLQKAASKGYAEAQYELGNGYYSGELNLEEAILIEKHDERDIPCDVLDNHQAFKWWLKAAKQNHAEAQNMLGYLYEEGDGVGRNIHKAIEWYGKACNNGDSKSCRKTELQDYIKWENR